MIWFHFIWLICVEAYEDYEPDRDVEVILLQQNEKKNQDPSNCWMSIRAPELFSVMEKLDTTYATARKGAQKYLDSTDFNDRMMKKMLCVGAAAQREIYKERPADKPKIPSGMHLGGMCMMRMPYSVLFFHRMKLRNDTLFRINFLHNDIENMVLKGHISLNDLHLVGAYDRSMTDKDPAELIYTPSFGELEILLEGVEYTIEGRYRLIKERLVIEVIVSTLDTKNIMLTYANATKTDPPIWIEKQHMGDFILRLKTDLDKWVQDYFNDYLIRQDLQDVPNISKLRVYDQRKASQLALFTDNALVMMNGKLRNIGGDSIRLPRFKTVTAHGLTMEIFAGTLRGLDTMYRRSVATTVLKQPNLRYVDTIIGFSNLKVSYRYEINYPPSPQAPPPLIGVLTLSTKEVTAHLSLGLLNKPEVLDLDIDFINRMGPESITVDGAANIMISNFKHILRHEIASIMSNSLTYGVGMLRTLPRCEPFTPGMLKKKNKPVIVKMTKDPSSSEEYDATVIMNNKVSSSGASSDGKKVKTVS